MTIDYSPLENAYNAPLTALRKWLKPSLVLVAIVVFCVMGGLAYIGLGGIDLLIILAAILLLTKYAMLAKRDSWTAFAQVNQWQLGQTTIDDVPPAIRGIGENVHLSTAILANVSDQINRLYTYDYTYGVGDFQSTPSFTILRVELPKTFPHIVLDSQANEDGVRRLFKDYKKVSLENNFDKYFRVYIQNNEQVDALSIITPDVMSHLVNGGSQLDIEINGTSLYFIITNANKSIADIKYLLESTQPIIDDMLHRAVSLNYMPIFDPEVANLSSRPLVSLTITSQSKKFLVIIAVAGIVIFALILFVAKQTLSVQSKIR